MLDLSEKQRDVADSGRRLVLVKIDIEGAGSAALTHCVNIAESQRCFFLIEYHPCEEDAAIGVFKVGAFRRIQD